MIVSARKSAGESFRRSEVSQAVMRAAGVVPHRLLLISVLVMAVFGSQLAEAAGPQRNVLMGQPYSLSTPPNYDGARLDTTTLLTDGQEASDTYWNNGTSLGWAFQTPVTVSFSLADTTAVSRVQVQAGAKTSGEIFYPSQILVFGGDGAGRFGFLGATGLQQDRESPSAGVLRQFDINFPPQFVREIVVIAFARGRYLFLGEIAAYASDTGMPLAGEPASPDLLGLEAAERRRQAIAALPSPKPAGPTITERWAMPLNEGSERQAEKAGTSCEVARIEPWSDGAGDQAAFAADSPLIALAGGRDYAAFRVTNRAAAPVKVGVSSQGTDQTTLHWHALAHVQAFDYSWVPDVVAPFAGGELPARSAMIVLIEIQSQREGEGRLSVDIGCGGETAHFDMPFRVIDAENTPPIHGNLWTYLHEPQHAPVARALACEPEFLSRFGIDTVVVHSTALLDDGGKRPTELLGRYFHDYRGARRALLFMDVKGGAWTFRKMPDDMAAQALRSWWDWVQQIAQAKGFKGEIILYPIDEPQPGDVPLLLKTRDLFRKAGITAKVYATVEQKTAFALGSLDILQLHRPTAILREAATASELQSYDTRQDSKLLPINGYYRMQGWQAFQLALAGIGIWSAWDGSGLGDPASGWDPFVGTRERDFGMLYVSPDGCGWPSRRLIAWRRGLEENRILRRCANQERMSGFMREIRAAVEGGPAVARQVLQQAVDNCGL